MMRVSHEPILVRCTGGPQLPSAVRAERGTAFQAPPAPPAGPPFHNGLEDRRYCFHDGCSIQFCTTSDGVRIAYSVSGEGLPLVKVMGYVTHVELDGDPAALPATRIGAIPGFSLIRFDKRGTGLSDRGVTDFSVETRVHDLEAVVEALSLKKFYLLGISEGGPISMMYAAQFPRRVIELALYGTTAHGGGGSPGSNALAALTRAEWGMGSDAMSGLFAPGASAEERGYVARYQRQSATADVAAAMIEAGQLADVRPLLPKIKTPTIVIHARGDRVMPFSGGRDIAGGIRGARLVPLASDRHAPTSEMLDEINELIRTFFIEGEHTRDAIASLAAGPPDRALHRPRRPHRNDAPAWRRARPRGAARA